MRVESDPGFFNLELQDRPSQAYNEKAFRYFLSIERKRSERSGRSFALLLVDLKRQPGTSERIDRRVAAKLFCGLWLCLRETDFVGWYCEERVAGAVLTHLADTPGSDLAGQARQRVIQSLHEGLIADVADRLQVRIYHLPAQAEELSNVEHMTLGSILGYSSV